jgi:hypothetical protein
MQTILQKKLLPAQTGLVNNFAQLVFDLYAGCYWEEGDKNLPTLIELTQKQLKENILPSMAPWHSLNFHGKGVDLQMIQNIAQANAEHDMEEAGRRASCSVPIHTGQVAHTLTAANPAGSTVLKIGYMSADFLNHPTADLIHRALPLHDQLKFQIFCYSLSFKSAGDKEDDCVYRQNLRANVHQFTDLPLTLTDEECAKMISADGIHILVAMNGYTEHSRNRILALRPAPVQLLYLAYPGTMGASYIDYNVTDIVVCPEEQHRFYTEALFVMPHCYQVNSFQLAYPDVLAADHLPTRAEYMLPEKAIVFCCFCRLGRVTKELFAVWMKILTRVPGSVLWLTQQPGLAVEILRNAATVAKVQQHRLLFAPFCTPKLNHLRRVTLADIALDTLVYNGHTTASDMLWSGIPLITMRGNHWPSLVATSIATAAGMADQMVVTSLQAYEDKAVELATNRELLKEYKTKLAEARMTSPLFDTQKWVCDFEIGLEEAWKRHSLNADRSQNLIVKDVKLALETAGSPNSDVVMVELGVKGGDGEDADSRSEGQPSLSNGMGSGGASVQAAQDVNLALRPSGWPEHSTAMDHGNNCEKPPMLPSSGSPQHGRDHCGSDLKNVPEPIFLSNTVPLSRKSSNTVPLSRKSSKSIPKAAKAGIAKAAKAGIAKAAKEVEKSRSQSRSSRNGSRQFLRTWDKKQQEENTPSSDAMGSGDARTHAASPGN